MLYELFTGKPAFEGKTHDEMMRVRRESTPHRLSTLVRDLDSVASRNLRLTAIDSFFRMVALRDPASVGIATRVLAIPLKRTDTRVRPYVTREEMDAILALLDRTTWCGRRDHTLLLTMYNTGARVSEMSSLKQDQISFGVKSSVHLRGKGRKERTVPLWSRTARTIR